MTEKLINRIDPSVPIVQQNGNTTEIFRRFLFQLERLGFYIGTGCPEGEVEATQGAFYMDDAGTSGSILYVKRDADDGAGDRTKGWILT